MVMVPEMITQRRLTFEDYLALPDDQDYEIIEGRLYLAPRPRPRHQIVGGRLASLLLTHVEPQGLGFVVPDADLIIDDRNTYVSPDIMYFTADRFAGVDIESWIRVVPDLIVEVVSPTSDDYDLGTKREIYAKLGVPHYWVAHPRTRSITEHVLLESGRYRARTVKVPNTFFPTLFPDLAIDLERLFP